MAEESSCLQRNYAKYFIWDGFRCKKCFRNSDTHRSSGCHNQSPGNKCYVISRIKAMPKCAECERQQCSVLLWHTFVDNHSQPLVGSHVPWADCITEVCCQLENWLRMSNKENSTKTCWHKWTHLKSKNVDVWNLIPFWISFGVVAIETKTWVVANGVSQQPRMVVLQANYCCRHHHEPKFVHERCVLNETILYNRKRTLDFCFFSICFSVLPAKVLIG